MRTDDVNPKDSLKQTLSDGIASLVLDVELYNYVLSIQEYLPDIILVEGKEMSREKVVAMFEDAVSQLEVRISLLEGIEQLLLSTEELKDLQKSDSPAIDLGGESAAWPQDEDRFDPDAGIFV